MKQDFTVELVGLYMVTPSKEHQQWKLYMEIIKEQTLHSALCGLEGVLYASTVEGLHEVFELLWRRRPSDHCKW